MSSGRPIKPKDLAILPGSLQTMMKAGVPLLQAFDIVGRGNPNPSVTKLLNDIRMDVETGTSLNAAFRKYPCTLTTFTATWSKLARLPVFWTSCWIASRSIWKRRKPSSPRSSRH